MPPQTTNEKHADIDRIIYPIIGIDLILVIDAWNA